MAGEPNPEATGKSGTIVIAIVVPSVFVLVLVMLVFA
jgi:hypothetical protein